MPTTIGRRRWRPASPPCRWRRFGGEDIIAGVQLHEVAVLVQQGEGVGLHAAGDELDGQPVGGGAVDLQHIPFVQGGVKADVLPGGAVADGGIDHDTRGAEYRGERNRQRTGVPDVEEVALPPLAVPVAVVAEREAELGYEAAHDGVLALEAVPVGLGAVEHEVQPGVRVELDGVGVFAARSGRSICPRNRPYPR